MKHIFYIIILLSAMASCEAPEVGYISDNIYALEDTIFVPRGTFMTSAPPSVEGSTYPMHWEITDIRDKSGNPTNALQEEHEILIWKESFNPDTDTTLALAEAKLELANKPSILINDVSGEMAFTQASKFVPADENIFVLDVNVSNVRGERQLNDYVIVKLEDFKPVEFPVEMIVRNNLIKLDGSKKALFASHLKNDYDDKVPDVLNGTDPYFVITKTNEEPKQGVRVKMIIADSHDQAFDPSKIVFYPSGASYLQNFHDNSTETDLDESGTIFSLPAPPFPQFGRSYSGKNTYLMYYLSTKDAYTVDKEAYEADYGVQDWSDYKVDETTGEIVCEAYIRWGIKINDSGSWEIKMRIPYSKKLE